MSWLVYAAIIVLSAAGIHIFSKLTDKVLSPDLALVFSMGAAFVLSVVFYVARGGQAVVLADVQVKGIVFAALAGACVTVANLAIFYMYNAQAPLSLAMPIVRMGAAVIAVLVGILFFKEQLSSVNYIGIAMAILAVVLITRAPA